ncbi:MAG: 16S rRNA (cytosine(1402)-N(4))-methyltransferase RsmH [Rudaea sp.]
MTDDNGAKMHLEHVPVMLEEVLHGLRILPAGTYFDGTFGRGGHARAMLARLGPDGRLLLMDRDTTAVAAARRDFAADARVSIRHGNFADLADWDATAAGLDGVLLDLGVSSPQLDDATRGFSFRADAPLDMRMDTMAGTSAADFVNHASEAQLTEVLFRFGEERQARRIARAIVAQRTDAPIARTLELAELIERTIGRQAGGKHPATRSFQALRIHVNAELEAVERGLRAAVARLKPGGRLAVISFHSLEDRAVKTFLRDESQQPPAKRGRPPLPDVGLRLKTIGSAQFAASEELAANPRARSAVLRVAERIA